MRTPLAAIALSVSLGLASVGPAVGLTAARAGPFAWSIQASPNPAGSTDSSLAAISCAGPRTCIAVGHSSGAEGLLTLAERWDGATWTIQSTRDVEKNNYLTGVSCVGPNWCIAVGSSITSRAVQETLVEMWDGRHWTVQPTPLPAGRGITAGLSAVSCTARDACTAVGAYSRSGVDAQEQPLAEYWNGAMWVIQPTPNPHAENGSELDGLSCTARNACTAGGNYAYADVDQSIFALGWDGTTWVRQHQPNPLGEGFNETNSVSCAAPLTCTSVGFWTNGGNGTQTLAETWNGARWARQRTVQPKGASNSELDGVSCAGISTCTTVGAWSTGSGSNPEFTLAERWNGVAWKLEMTPNPTGAEISSLSGVDCRPSGACVAVGSFWNGTTTQTLIEAHTT